jgi:thymidylate synthase
MSSVDQQLKALYQDIIENGVPKDTRTGQVLSVWDRSLSFDLSREFPAVTSKRLAWNPVVGELLWFLAGSYWLRELKHYTFGDAKSDKWTIWTDDTARWGSEDFVGHLYGHQWRNSGGTIDGRGGVDQIANLLHMIKTDPHRRDLIVMAWNPYDIANNEMALKPCHLGFQCYVDGDLLNLKWEQRSVDSFLGLPFNIASYALLTHLLAQWTGLKPGIVSCSLGDTHLYNDHLGAVDTYINNPMYTGTNLILPLGTHTLDDTLELTANHFGTSLANYQSAGVIKAPLSVGK